MIQRLSLHSWIVSLLTASLVALDGCAHKKPVIEWIPTPTVHWADLCDQPLPSANDSHTLIVSEPTSGLFPASMAVTRLAVMEDKCADASRKPVLLTDPRNEFLQWNSALDDKMAVSEVFPIFERDLGGNEANPDQILAAFRALDSRLGLIYAVNEISVIETETMGVLYDVKASKPIAAIHAHARSTAIMDDKSPMNLWKTDSKALARAEFEASLRRCVRELITHDRPPEIESVEGWTPLHPVRPPEWPPRSR